MEPDCGVECRSHPVNTHDSPPLRPPLLKVHGSLNWLYCPACNALDFFPTEKIAAQIIQQPNLMTCPSCQEPRAPILIPPTFFKVMSNFYLQQIWKKAEHILREAEHLIFCGYSFPDADLHFKYLLKRGEINRPGHSPKPLEVFIINEHPAGDPKPKTDEQRKEEQGRYLRFFREKKLVHWTKLSFADFAAKPESYADPVNWV
jgi:hypothetical protein